ncbi:MAG: aspartate aminotransferase family protein [Limisphaerales bacterium]
MTKTETLQLLRDYESRNVVHIESDGSWPIVWERAKNVFVWDADGKKYLDLTAAFGVAAAGHANPNVVKAGQKQMAKLLHAMGDVHPHARKAELAKKLNEITFERWTSQSKAGAPAKILSGKSAVKKGKTIFCNSGFEAVEAALKTAMLATGKSGVIAFTGAYHGLGYGVLNVTHRNFFREPFHSQLREFGNFVPFPNFICTRRCEESLSRKNQLETCDLVSYENLTAVESEIRSLFQRKKIGAILVEPIQVRGGVNIPPKEFLPLLRKLCDEFGALLILDEIYTGFGRTGKWFACEHSGPGILPVSDPSKKTDRLEACPTIPDLICLGKALTGGFPLSACVGRADLMDAAWPASTGEAIHTSTFLGHPVGCAMALAQIEEIERLKLCERSAESGKFLLAELDAIKNSKLKIQNSARGLGLLAGIELNLPDGKPATTETFEAIKKMLRRGFILLPEGEHGNVISFTPPLTISKKQLAKTVKTLLETLNS